MSMSSLSVIYIHTRSHLLYIPLSALFSLPLLPLPSSSSFLFLIFLLPLPLYISSVSLYSSISSSSSLLFFVFLLALPSFSFSSFFLFLVAVSSHLYILFSFYFLLRISFSIPLYLSSIFGSSYVSSLSLLLSVEVVQSVLFPFRFSYILFFSSLSVSSFSFS